MEAEFDRNPEFARLLGIMLERWSFLERELAISLSHLLDGNSDAAFAIIYSMNATKVRIELVRSVARSVMPDGPEKSGLLYLLDKINKLARERNEFVHGEYAGAEGGQLERLLLRPMNATPFELQIVSHVDLQKHISAVELRFLQLQMINAKDVRHWVPRRP